MIKPLHALLGAKRKNKRIITISYDIIAIIASLYLATAIRLNEWSYPINLSLVLTTVVTTAITIFCFTRLGMYRAVLRFMMLPALGYIFIAVFISSLTLAFCGFFFQAFIPRSVPLIYVGLAIITLGGPRIMIRTIYYHYYRRKKPNVFVYGAGSTGRELSYALISGSEYHPVIILDDDYSKVGQIIFGLRVHHSSEFTELQNLYKPVKLLLAIKNVSPGKRLRLIEKTSDWPIAIQSVPSVEDIASGKAKSTEIRDLYISDLLGREQVTPNNELLQKNITNHNIMITGAGGSIGTELCRQILKQHPTKIVLFELNEYNLYSIDRELRNYALHTNTTTQIISALGNVQKQNHIERLMIAHNIDTVFHAAAYKHVPLVEDNVIEGICNNVFGTLAAAEAAINAGVKNFTLISTDKAVRPTNIMGATKRMAELVLQSLADRQSNTIFTMVRFGNVLGSSGSVVPLFKEQISKGGPVTVTHPDINRFFMLIPEAAQLVIQASAMAKNGQVFVLDMGEPVKILELAKRMIHLMGFSEQINSEQDGDIEIQFTGLRPGEKLYEELLIGNNVEGTAHPKIMTAMEDKLSWDEMKNLFIELDNACQTFDEDSVIEIIKNSPTGYHQEKEL
ncbi:NAD-dependent epimerase/dehydratase family protein [Photobacterium carnosum]|uniref:polysaccharide biosynthesis protein n=1 Tax=Photobacterium carnosum TaxID=2023717 RepID=UPI001F1F3069|nr:nucleoside-diphosphate sugar epimerase/dehydratase [Photobacterium carnosum]MCF2155740.1 NAD-dependent epimerase/dehydratase family protein [Photobacterium carnosum]MCF2217579.1 NAD-dependent epimerase/dehydratase family protein [Photobacterium carnosum]